jgi:hypothetical protein
MKIVSKLLCSIWAIALLAILDIVLPVAASGVSISPFVNDEQIQVSIAYDGASSPTFDYDSTSAHTANEKANQTRTGAVFGRFPEFLAAEETEVGASAIPKGGPCFAAGTKVSTPAGEVDIENIKVGDTVYAYDFGESKVVEEPVEAIHQNFTYHWVEIEADGEVIHATRSHPFWVQSEKRWFRAADLKPGMMVLLQSGQAVAVSAINFDNLDQAEATYNFEVAYQHNYFVGENRVLVHNGPSFIVTANGTVFPMPSGAVGPGPVNSGNGFSFTGGSGGNGLSPQTTGLRIMDPTPRYPNGYGVYMNSATPTAQTVNPYTGRTIPPSDPLAHIPCD